MLTRKLGLNLLALAVAATVDGFETFRPRSGFSFHSDNGRSGLLAPAATTVTCSPPRASKPNSIQLYSSSNDMPSGDNDKNQARSVNDILNELGLSFKIRAEETIEKSKEATTRSKRIFYGLVSSAYFIAFLFYRAYRGFFVLLPAVFRRVYSSLETTVETDLSLDDGKRSLSDVQSTSWKTKVTVSVLASVMTFAYFMGGLFRIFGRFFRTVAQTCSVSESFGAAAKEAVDHEDRIRRRMSLSQEGNSGSSIGSDSKGDGLLP